MNINHQTIELTTTIDNVTVIVSELLLQHPEVEKNPNLHLQVEEILQALIKLQQAAVRRNNARG